MTSINSVTQQHRLFFLLRFRQDGVFRFRMPACRLAERRHRRSPHRSQLPCPDLRLRPHCRTNRRDPNRHEEFSSCTTCHRYRDAGSKMYMHFRHGSLRPQQARIQTADKRVDRSYLQIRGAGFTKKIKIGKITLSKTKLILFFSTFA